MKALYNFLFEKLHLNKDIKVSGHDMYFVIPRNNVFSECMLKYERNIIHTNNERDTGFILWGPDIKYLLKKYHDDITKYPNDLNIYEIPDEYDTWNTFKEDVEKFKIKIEDLTKIENEDFR